MKYFQALLNDNFIVRETIVQENGKISTDMEDSKVHFSFEDKFYPEKGKHKPLKVKKKLYEFFTAPITKFWANSVSTFFNIFLNILFF